MTKRKLMLVALSLCMVAILAMGGTLAYLTDDDAKTNTFTVGNVNIHIDEYMTDPETGKWVEYKDNQNLVPKTQADQINNKMVETVNDGSEPAYIRTFVTCPTHLYGTLGLGFNKTTGTFVGTTYGMKGTTVYGLTDWADTGITITIDNVEHSVFVCEYNGIVQPGESVLSLAKVWVYDDVTSEELKTLNLSNKEAFNIHVASQAIQSESLDYAEAMGKLGTIDATLLNKLFKVDTTSAQ